MSRAFVKEDDEERGNLVSDIQYREKKAECEAGKLTPEDYATWLRES